MHFPSTIQTATDRRMDPLKKGSQGRAIAKVQATYSQGGLNKDNQKTLEQIIEENFLVGYEMKASSLVLKTTDDLLGSLINTKV